MGSFSSKNDGWGVIFQQKSGFVAGVIFQQKRGGRLLAFLLHLISKLHLKLGQTFVSISNDFLQQQQKCTTMTILKPIFSIFIHFKQKKLFLRSE
ncbi:MAG: hypothetical protein GY795_45060 [Desulfobacterales bacterium]|nr:hypothetical protein [Desulfobacterales bacterium]